MIDILICPDHNYIMPSGVMLESLFLNNKEKIRIHTIVDDDVTQKDKEKLRSLVGDFGGEIFFYNINPNEIDNYPGIGIIHITRAAYYRLFAADILSTDIHKVLYLDGDIIIRHSLSELWSEDISDVAIGCVMDMYAGVISIYNRLQLDFNHDYINSGVLIMNLDYWRHNNLISKSLQFIKEHPDMISKLVDQDVINKVLNKEKKLLSLKYNVQEGFFYKPCYSFINYWKYEKEIKEVRKDPVVLHYTGSTKPWMTGCKHPLKSEFFKYQRLTEWADCNLVKPKAKIRLKTFIHDILIKLGIIDAKEKFVQLETADIV